MAWPKPVSSSRVGGQRGSLPRRRRLRGRAGLRRGVDLALELVRVGVDLLLDDLVRARERLLELLLELGLAEHDHGGRPPVELVAELLEVAARHALAQMRDEAAGPRTDDGAAEDRGREDDPDERADPRAGP